MRSALLLPLLIGALACASPPKPTPADVEAAITRADFAAWLAGYELETKEETLSKTTRRGITILEYHWMGDDGELAIRVDSRIYWTRTEAEAEAAYRKLREDGRNRHPAIRWFPVHSGGKWAQQKKVYRIVRADRQTVGHVLFARRDNVAVMVSVTGIHSEDPKLFERTVEPALEQLSQHDPRPLADS